MPKETNSQDSPELLDALESIKGLLEQSESKLSAARASLQKAKPQTNQQDVVRPSVSSEPVVPVLDDVVASQADDLDDEDLPLLDDNVPVLDDDVPVLDSILEPEPGAPQPAPLPQSTGHSTDEVHAYIDQLQQQLEKELRTTLMRTVVNIETEIKKTLAEQIQKLKDEIEQARQD
jgi:hypothetical protein